MYGSYEPTFLIRETERFWVYMQPFLLHRGYKLRPRFDPNWRPSWLQTRPGEQKLEAIDFEDHNGAGGGMLDAIRLQDGRKVVMKKVQTRGDELPISLFFSSKQMRQDPRNCAVPILDVILIPGNDDYALLVLPHLLPWHILPFRRVGEFSEMALQLLEGLELMHEQNIAHRDACYNNLLMDHSKMVPRGTHFCNRLSHDGVTQGLQWNSRWFVRPVQYYIIDFGISTPCRTKDEKVLGVHSQDKTVPELSNTIPYNPFSVDIYQLCNVFKECIEKYDGLSAFKQLSEQMTVKEPSARPTAAEAVRLCKAVIAKLEKSGRSASHHTYGAFGSPRRNTISLSIKDRR